MKYVVEASAPDSDELVWFIKLLWPEETQFELYHRTNGAPTARRFYMDKLDSVVDQIAIWQNGSARNVHPCVGSTSENPTTVDNVFPADRRPTIDRIHFLAVDLDPPKSTGKRDHMTPAEREKWLADVVEVIKASSLRKPTATIFTGGGLQLFHVLKMPVAVDATVKSVLRRLHFDWLAEMGDLVGGDNCTAQPIALMRMAGTINFPSEDKIASGQIQCLARRIPELCSGTRYAFSEFELSSDNYDWDAEDIVVENIPLPDKPAEPGALPWVKHHEQLNLDCRGQKHFTDHSRSGIIASLITKWSLRGAPKSDVLSLITNPAHKVSGHFTKNGESPKLAMFLARRQIAKLWKTSTKAKKAKLVGLSYEAVKEVVEKGHFQINFEGTFRIAPDEQPTNGLELWSKHDSVGNLGPLSVYVDDNKARPFIKAWLEDPKRRFYRGIVVDPDYDETSEDPPRYNLWTGWNVDDDIVEAMRKLPDDKLQERFRLFREHISLVLAGNYADHKECDEYIWNFFCWIIQNPAELPRQAMVFKGIRGCGKNILLMMISSPKGMLGRHGLYLSRPEQLTGNFNAMLADKRAVFLDEALSFTKEAQKAMDTLVSEQFTIIEKKGIDAKQTENRIALLLSTNERKSIQVSPDERRYMMFHCTNHANGNKPYFNALADEFYEGGGKEALFVYWRERMTLPKGWHPEWSRFNTIELRGQMERFMSVVERAFFQMLNEGEPPCNYLEADDGGIWVPRNEFKNKAHLKHPEAYTEMCELFDVLSKGEEFQFVEGTGSRRCAQLPPLARCRQLWSQRHGYTKPEWINNDGEFLGSWV